MNLRKIRFIDVVNPLKWLSFLRGYFNSFFLKDHLIEQFAIRLVECSGCVEEGQCKHCGCAMPEKAFDPKATCSMNNWGEMEMNREAWIEHKKRYGISFVVKYNPQEQDHIGEAQNIYSDHEPY